MDKTTGLKTDRREIYDNWHGRAGGWRLFNKARRREEEYRDWWEDDDGYNNEENKNKVEHGGFNKVELGKKE